MFKKIFFLIFTIFSTNLLSTPTIKNAETDIFKKWLSWQKIYTDEALKNIGSNIDDGYLNYFKTFYEKNLTLLSEKTKYLSHITHGQINENGYQLQSKIDENFKTNLCKIYEMLDENIPGLVKHMQENEFTDAKESQQETLAPSSEIIEKHEALTSMLITAPSDEVGRQRKLALANRLFEYSFASKTFFEFERLSMTNATQPISRLFYSIMWKNLAGEGWCYWLKENITKLKNYSDQGKQIVYLAGGCDIYQLIKNGIYNIKNIDPILPSQTKYYSEGWDWLAKSNEPKNGIGDKVVFDCGTIMERVKYEENGSFKARIDNGKIIQLPKATTIWKISNAEGVELGQYIHERRFIEQQDLTVSPDKIFMMSFNELYYLALPDFLNGWQIDTFKLDDNFEIIIKQLRRPVDKKTMCNMNIASIINATDLHYLNLGTCIN